MGYNLPGGIPQSSQSGQDASNSILGPSRITHSLHAHGAQGVLARQDSGLSSLEGEQTQPEAMRQIGKMVRVTAS